MVLRLEHLRVTRAVSAWELDGAASSLRSRSSDLNIGTSRVVRKVAICKC